MNQNKQRLIQIMNNKQNFFSGNTHLVNKSKLQSVKYDTKPSLANLMNQYSQNQHHNINLKLNSHIPKIQIEVKENFKLFGYRKNNYEQQQQYQQNINVNFNKRKSSQSPFSLHSKQNQKPTTYKAKTFAECIKQIEMQKARQQQVYQDSDQNYKIFQKKNSRSPFRVEQNIYQPQPSPFSTGLSHIAKQKTRLKDDQLVFKAKGDNKFVNFAQLARRYNNDKGDDLIQIKQTNQQNKAMVSQGFNTKFKSKQSIQNQFKQNDGDDQYSSTEQSNPSKTVMKFVVPIPQKTKNNILGCKKNSIVRETVKQNLQTDNRIIVQSRSIEQMKQKANKEIQQFARNMFKQKAKQYKEENLIDEQNSPKAVIDTIKDDDEQQSNYNSNNNKFFSFEKQFKAHTLKNVDSLKRLHNNLNAIIQEEKSSYYAAQESKSSYVSRDDTQKNNRNISQKFVQSEWLKPAQSIIYNNAKIDNNEIQKYRNLQKSNKFSQQIQKSLKINEATPKFSKTGLIQDEYLQDQENKQKQLKKKQQIQQQLKQMQLFAHQQMRRKQQQEQEQRLLEQKLKKHKQKEEQKKARQLQYQKKLELQKKKSSLFSSESEIQSLHASEQQQHIQKKIDNCKEQEYQYCENENQQYEEEQQQIEEVKQSLNPIKQYERGIKYSFKQNCQQNLQKEEKNKIQSKQYQKQRRNELEEKIKQQLEQQYQLFQMKKNSNYIQNQQQQNIQNDIHYENQAHIQNSLQINNHQQQLNTQIQLCKNNELAIGNSFQFNLQMDYY